MHDWTMFPYSHKVFYHDLQGIHDTFNKKLKKIQDKHASRYKIGFLSRGLSSGPLKWTGVSPTVSDVFINGGRYQGDKN